MGCHGGGESGHVGAALCCSHRRKVHHCSLGNGRGGRLRRRKGDGRKGRGGRRRCSCRDGGHGGGIAGNPLGPHGHEGCQEGDALGLGVVRAPPPGGVLLVTNLTTAFRSSPDMVSSPLSPRRSLAAAAATSAWTSSRLAALSASAAAFSAFARMAVCAAMTTNSVAPQTTHRLQQNHHIW